MKLSRILRWTPAAIAVAAGALWLSIPDVKPLRDHPPGDTAFMRLRREEAKDRERKFKIRHTWVPLGSISPSLQRAVIVSEDGAFYSHGAVDVDEIKASLERDLKTRRISRGGSTITQQLAKNLYLSPSKNPIRKLREVLIAYELEQELSKNRILELYLNSIEWGDGVFGAEAAARNYFGVSARSLSSEQAALLAAIIPNPRRLGKLLNSRRVQHKKQIILVRMRSGRTPPREELEDVDDLEDPDPPSTPPVEAGKLEFVEENAPSEITGP